MAYWWCLDHMSVEDDGGCANMKRLGPYDDEQTAATALDRTRARTQAEDARDEAWEEGSPT